MEDPDSSDLGARVMEDPDSAGAGWREPRAAATLRPPPKLSGPRVAIWQLMT